MFLPFISTLLDFHLPKIYKSAHEIAGTLRLADICDEIDLMVVDAWCHKHLINYRTVFLDGLLQAVL